MHVRMVDPSAFTPPYDHALCSALAAKGVQVTLETSEFAYGQAPAADGYEVAHSFYRRAQGSAGGRLRQFSKLASHVPEMRALGRRSADLFHFQWLDVQQIDRWLLPKSAPLVLTAHDVLPREASPGQRSSQRRLYESVDAVVVHSEHGRQRLVGELDLDARKVHLIPHGAFDYVTKLPREPLPLADSQKPVVLFFGLLRPYKGVDLLLAAWRQLAERTGAELWIVGRSRMDASSLRAAATDSVKFVDRFVSDGEMAALFGRADLVVLPYREIDQSGVLFTALACGTPMLLSDVGGFPEVAAKGAAAIFESGNVSALAAEIERLIAAPEARSSLARSASALASGEYSWQNIAAQHKRLYESLLSR